MDSGPRNTGRRRGSDELNHRQMELLLYALRHPQTEFSTISHQRAQGVDYQMARADLMRLEELGYLQKRRLGRSYVFTPVDDLDQRVAGLM
jgi:Fic family protein